MGFNVDKYEYSEDRTYVFTVIEVSCTLRVCFNSPARWNSSILIKANNVLQKNDLATFWTNLLVEGEFQRFNQYIRNIHRAASRYSVSYILDLEHRIRHTQ